MELTAGTNLLQDGENTAQRCCFFKRSGNRSDGVNSPFKVEGGGWASKKTEREAVKSDLPQLESAAGSAE